MRKTFVTAVIGCVLTAGAATCSFAQTQPDNTKMNKADRNSASPTADQSKNNKSDLQMSKDIRRAIVKDKSLSVYAHNVKVIVQGGNVTLRGPVHTDEEKSAIEQHAKEVAGAGTVTNDITVKGDTANANRSKK